MLKNEASQETMEVKCSFLNGVMLKIEASQESFCTKGFPTKP